MSISDEAVEAAVNMHYDALMSHESVSDYGAMRAALEAAMPFLLAEKDAEIERIKFTGAQVILNEELRTAAIEAERDAALAEVDRLGPVKDWHLCGETERLNAELDALRAKVAGVEEAISHDSDGTGLVFIAAIRAALAEPTPNEPPSSPKFEVGDPR